MAAKGLDAVERRMRSSLSASHLSDAVIATRDRCIGAAMGKGMYVSTFPLS